VAVKKNYLSIMKTAVMSEKKHKRESDTLKVWYSLIVIEP
jgi:hypothetical protein